MSRTIIHTSLKCFVLAVALIGVTAPAHAVVIYDEFFDGDAPDPLGFVDLGLLGPGIHTVIGNLPGENDFDGFGFTIGPGTTVPDIILANFVGPGGSFDFAPGKAFPGIPGIGMGHIGMDLLDIVQVPNPLAPGAYGFQVRTGTNENPLYEINIIVDGDVPEPATLFLVSLGLAGLVSTRRRTGI